MDWKTIAAIITALVGLAGIITILVRQGRYAERIENRITSNEDKVSIVERTLWTKEGTLAVVTHTQHEEIKKTLWNDDGTLAVVTHMQHDKLQATCRNELKQEMGHQNTDIMEIKTDMKDLVTCFRKMQKKQDERWLEMKELILQNAMNEVK